MMDSREIFLSNFDKKFNIRSIAKLETVMFDIMNDCFFNDKSFSADEVHKFCDFGKSFDKRAIGGVFQTFMSRDLIKKEGLINSRRRACHYRPIFSYVPSNGFFKLNKK